MANEEGLNYFNATWKICPLSFKIKPTFPCMTPFPLSTPPGAWWPARSHTQENKLSRIIHKRPPKDLKHLSFLPIIAPNQEFQPIS
jgi:hypothetical protein